MLLRLQATEMTLANINGSNSLEGHRYFQNPGSAEDTDLSKDWNQNTVGDLGVH